MSIFCYNLDYPEKIFTLKDLHALIITTCNQIPATIYASMNYGTQCMAFRLCCDEDIISLKKICKSSPVSILYIPKPHDFPQDFRGFEPVPIKSLNNLDFSIMSTEGVKDGDSISKNQSIEKTWRIILKGDSSNLEFKCVEGDYFGVHGKIQAENHFLELKVQLYAGPVDGWSSSFWRLFSFGVPFGPGLWVEMMII